MRVYNGQNVKDIDSKAKRHQEYKDSASKLEGFEGISTRLCYKILGETFNYDRTEVAADPVHLFVVLHNSIAREHFPENVELKLNEFIEKYLVPEYSAKLEKDIQTSYLEAYTGYGQTMFDKYLVHADHWLQDNDFRDPDSGRLYDKAELNEELEEIEKAAGISNPKDFRNEVVNFTLRYKAQHGKNPSWTSYAKLREIIEKKMFSKTRDLLPIISFSVHKTKEEAKQHREFVERMKTLGYTEKMIQRATEWFGRRQKSE
jgi:serine protein kinase